MDACWRELAACCELRIFIEPSPLEHRFDGSELDGLDWRRVEIDAIPHALDEILAFRPDAVIICGWSTPLAIRAAAADLGCRTILDTDMPWEPTLRKFAARWALRPRLRHFDAAFVPGRRALKYAEWLGFKGRVTTGSNTSGWERFRDAGVADSGFVFVGRLSEEKALDVLIKGYALYRKAVDAPWGLDIVGDGGVAIPECEGVRLLGFARPGAMPAIVGAHASLVLPSRSETWGVSALEAMSAGLAVIASDACGFIDDAPPAAVFPSGDAGALCDAMVRIHAMSDAERSRIAAKSRAVAECYSAELWADRAMGVAFPSRDSLQRDAMRDWRGIGVKPARRIAGWLTAMVWAVAGVRRLTLRRLREGASLPVVVHALPAGELRALLSWLRRHGVLDRLWLSFDDGWATVRDCVPVLEEFGVRARLFIAPGETIRGRIWTDAAMALGVPAKVWRSWYGLGEGERYRKLDEWGLRSSPVAGERALLSEADVRELARHPLIDVENHTWSHLSATHRPKDEVIAEIERAQLTLKEWTGRAPRLLAWPFGRGSDTLDASVRDMGLEPVYTRQGLEVGKCRNMAIEGVTFQENLGRILGAWPCVGRTL
jgi:glycosyltransferase involved in cell wall biosynthesis/peptidoglycan/xylan/chitin deacetylase (PgdA/CDA1 family)